MGSLYEDAHAAVLIADFIGIDAAGKINAIGAGFTAVPKPVPGAPTAAHHVVVLIDIPSSHGGEEFSLSLELRNETRGTTVLVPGPTGTLEALRLQQVARVDRPTSNDPTVYIPSGMFCRVQMAIGFPTGLPLEGGNTYAWKLQIDGQSRKHWYAQFAVLGDRPGPVFGGPSGPADIPNMPPPVAET